MKAISDAHHLPPLAVTQAPAPALVKRVAKPGDAPLPPMLQVAACHDSDANEGDSDSWYEP